MKTQKSSSVALLVSVVATVAFMALPDAAHAALRVYEPFDYTTGTPGSPSYLAGKSGGTGFAAAWLAQGGDTAGLWDANPGLVVNGALEWDGVIDNIPASPPFVGASGDQGSANIGMRRQLSSSAGAMAALAAPTDVLWMSAVVRLKNRGGGAGVSMGLGDGHIYNRGLSYAKAGATFNFAGSSDRLGGSWLTGLNALLATNIWTSGASYDGVNGTGANDMNSGTADGNYVVVFKYTFDPDVGDNDTVKVYAFGEDVPLSETTFDSSGQSASFPIDETTMNIFSWTQTYGQNAIDEVRIGDTFDDVIAASLAGVTDTFKSSVEASSTSVPADGATTSTITVTLLDGFSTPLSAKSVALGGSTGNATITTNSGTTDASGIATFTVSSSAIETEVFSATNTTDAVTILETASVSFLGATDADTSTVTGTRDLVAADGSATSTITVTLKDAVGNVIAGDNITLAGAPAGATITPAPPQVSDVNGQASFDVSSSSAGTVVFTATDTTESVTITETFSVTFGAEDTSELLVYEPFNYDVGALAGSDGGLGFASAWATPNSGAIGWVWDPNNGTVTSWDGAITSIPVSTVLGENRFTGGAAVNATEYKRDIYRELSSSAGAMAGTDGVLWMSAVLYRASANNVGVGLGLGNTVLRDRGGYQNFANSEVGAQTAFAGAIRHWSTGGGDNRLNAVIATNKVNTAGNYDATAGAAFTEDTYVLVFKFRFSGIEDSVETYAFPESATLSEATFDANKITATFPAGFDEDACNLLTWSSARIATCLDEIRIGSTFNDIITAAPVGPTDADASTVVASPVGVPADGSTVSTITVTLIDALGQAVTNRAVSLVGSTGNATITTNSTTSDANGQVTFDVTSATAEAEVFTATDTTDAVPITQTATVTFTSSADAGNSTVVASPDTIVADGSATSTITVTLKDSLGNVVPVKDVSLTGSTGNAVITTNNATTDGSGEASFTVTSSTAETEVFTATDTTDAVTITQTASVTFLEPETPALLVYEGFDYTPVNDQSGGVLAGKNGGVGWSGAWVDGPAGLGGEAFIYDSNGNSTNLYYTTVPGDTPNQTGPTWDGDVTNLPQLGNYAGLSPWSSLSGNAQYPDSYRPLAQSAADLAGVDNTLWLSAVVHFPNNGFGGVPGIALTDGGYIIGRADGLTGGNAIGIANGVGRTGSGDVKPIVWIDSSSRPADGPDLSTTEDNIIIVKFVFGATDTVYAYSFKESEVLDEATFNANAVWTNGVVDESTLSTLSYSLAYPQNAIDEIRMGVTFDDVISFPASSPTDSNLSSVVASPTAVSANGSETSTITVTLQDAFGRVVTNHAVSLTGDTGNATIVTNSATSDSNGQVTFDVSSSTVETEVFTATDTNDSVTITQTASVAFVSGADAGTSTVVASPDIVVADGVSTSTVTVTVKDPLGNGLPGKDVTLSGSTGNAVITTNSATTDGSGQATFTVASSTAETEVFTATDTTDAVTITQTASVEFRDPASLVLLVYEPFDYAPGVLTGQNGGTGFASAWQEASGNEGYVWWPNASDTDPAGSDWDGVITNVPTSSALGEYRFAGGAEASVAHNRDIYRTLSSSAGAMAGGDNVLWMSVVLHYGNGGSFALGLGDGYVRNRGLNWQNSTTNFIGWDGYTTTWLNGTRNAMISTNASGGHYEITTGGTLNSPTKDYVLVFKFTFSSGSGDDTCQTYAFDETTPLSEATFNINALSATVAGFDESACDVFSYTHNYQNNLIDEIRIGDTFHDVTAGALAGVTDAAKSTVAASPSSVPADGSTTSTITVTLRDGFSTAISGKDVALSGDTGNATITPLSATTDGSGEATFTVKSSTAETETFTASNTTDSAAIWQTASVDFLGSTDADTSTVTGTRDLVAADGLSTSTITVTLKDASGNAIVGNNITLAGAPGGATISPAGAQVSDANGQASFDVSSSTAGTVVFTGTDTTKSVTITETFSVSFGTVDPSGILVYEPFDYDVGPLAGKDGGLGFASAWTNPANGEIGWVWDPSNGTLMADGATMNWDGVIANTRVSRDLGENRFTGGAASVGEAKRDIYRELASSAGEMAGSDGVLWMSAVLYRGSSGNVGVGLGLGNTILRDRGGFVNFSNAEVGAQTAFVGALRHWYGGGGDSRLNAVIATNRVNASTDNIDYYEAAEGAAFSEDDYVLVFKFRFSGIEDSVESYAFPESETLSKATFNANKISATFSNGFDEDACNLLTWSSARGATCLDEIRIGNTFYDVVSYNGPEKGMLILIK